MADEDIRILGQAILDYFDWLKPTEKPKEDQLRERYGHILIEFLICAVHKKIAWKDMFTFDTLRVFRKNTGIKSAALALISLSRYLYQQGRIAEPLEIPNYQVHLPDIYEQYLLYLQQGKAVSVVHVKSSRRVLASLHAYLEHHKIVLSALKIERIDAFLAEFNKPFSTVTRRTYRTRLRGFLKYLYYDGKMLGKDLAPLLVGPRVFNQSKPPKFLRPQEVKTLFNNLTLDTPTQIQTYAMVLLAYSLGLRPAEISQITLDDISFQKGELTIRKRKMCNPVVLPIPDKALKAVAAYVFNVRPKTPYRELFLTRHAPYRPVSASVVIYHISKIMKQAGLCSTSYWLRHSYAQNLLESGIPIFEIKEMMGHENIRSTQRYLHIHTELMRKVLFDEIL